MCGLFGFSLRAPVARGQLEDMLIVLALENERRGDDSWGFWSNNLGVKKGIGSITTADEYYRPMTRATTVMAHTRWATTGKVIAENSHPFEIRNLIGAHNGVVSNHWELNHKYERGYAVDSMHIFGHMANNLSLSEVHAYGAITFVNKRRPDRVCMGRFNGGSLSLWGIGRPDRPKGVVWSSDKDAVKKALRLAHLKGTEYRIPDEKLIVVQSGTPKATTMALNFSPCSTARYADYGNTYDDDYLWNRREGNSCGRTVNTGTGSVTIYDDWRQRRDASYERLVNQKEEVIDEEDGTRCLLCTTILIENYDDMKEQLCKQCASNIGEWQ
jgi:hypothetical protein